MGMPCSMSFSVDVGVEKSRAIRFKAAIISAGVILVMVFQP